MAKRILYLMLMLLMPFAMALPDVPAPRHSYRVANAQEFEQAVQKVQPGEEIVLAQGHWTDLHLCVDAMGKKGQMIYVRGEDPRKTILDGSTRLSISGDYIYLYHLSFKSCVATSPHHKASLVSFKGDRAREANHSVISDCHFDACVPEDKSFDDVWISLYGTHNTVQYCTMEGKDNKGLYIVVWHKNDKADYHMIRRNSFHRPKTFNREENGQEIIRVGDSHNSLTDSYTVIEENFFYQCNGEVEVISIKSGNNIIRGNTFLECRGALTLRHGNDNKVENNFFLANGIDRAGGVRVINKGQVVRNNYFYGHCSGGVRAPISLMQGVKNGALNTYDQVQDALIADNTLVDCAENFSFGVKGKDTSLDPVRSVVKNCFVLTTKARKADLIDANGGDISGIRFEKCHLQGSDGLKRGQGMISARYKTGSFSLAGCTYPLYLSTCGAQVQGPVALPSNCGVRVD